MQFAHLTNKFLGQYFSPNKQSVFTIQLEQLEQQHKSFTYSSGIHIKDPTPAVKTEIFIFQFPMFNFLCAVSFVPFPLCNFLK